MSFWAPDNLREVTAGRWLRRPQQGDALAEPFGVSIDSRTIERDNVFVALRGERFDGHDYLQQATDRGGALLVVDRDDATRPAASPALLVADTQAALTRLATAYRRRLSATVIAITGSVGKTTTKALIHAVLSPNMPGRAAPRSYNNQIGVPLTLLGARPTDRYVLVEVGTSAPGEIARLARIVEPDVAIITAIGHAHIEKLGSLAGVAEEKAALLRHLRDDGLAIVNGDAPHLGEHLKHLRRLVRYGRSEACDLRLTDCRPVGSAMTFTINDRATFTLPLAGEHNVVNALAAVAVGRHLNLDDPQIVDGLARAVAPPMRLQTRVLGGAEGLTLINDAYNANPDSMAAAIAVLAGMDVAGRRIAMLGDMAELGDAGPRMHRELGGCVAAAGIDRATFIGPLSAHAAGAMAEAGGEATHIAELTDAGTHAIAAELRPGDAVLVKASRSMRLERLADAIAERFTEQDSTVI